MRVTFYHPLTSVDMSQNYGFFGRFSLSKASVVGCGYVAVGEIYNGQHHVRSRYGTFFDRALVQGYSGYLSFTRASLDGQTIELRASAPGIAARDIQCLHYELGARRISTISNPSSDYDPNCDCWYVSPILDIAGCASPTGCPSNYFAGFGMPGPEEDPAGVAGPFRLKHFSVKQYACLKEFGFNIAVTGNARAAWEATFAKRRGGPVRARLGGTVKRSQFLSRHRPPALKIDQRYYARVTVTRDGLTDRSAYQAIRIRSCL